MRIAVSIWEDRISPVFDVSRTILVLDIENGVITGNFMETFAQNNPVYKLSRLSALKVHTLICGAVSKPLADMLAASGIHTIPFIAGEKEHVISAFISNTLPNPAFSMPGLGRCHGHRRKNAVNSSRGSADRSIKEVNTMPNRNGKGPRGQGSQSGQGPGRGQGGGKKGFGGGQGAGGGRKGGRGQGPCQKGGQRPAGQPAKI
jgi:predicted Fe-Mo cluster-binding NifX family protein